MITLVTGHNNINKSDWIYNQILPKIESYISETQGHISYYENLFKEQSRIFKEEITAHFWNTDELSYGLSYGNDLRISYFKSPENNFHPKIQIEIVEEIIEHHNDNYDIFIETYSETIFYALRVAVKENKIDVDKIKFIFIENDSPIEVKVDSRGRIDESVKGFFDTFRILQSKLL